jgi:hypothetical protein
MIWALIVLILFICVFLLIARVYGNKGKLPKGTSDTLNEDTVDTVEADDVE